MSVPPGPDFPDDRNPSFPAGADEPAPPPGGPDPEAEQSDFLAGLAQELRPPLQSVTGMVERLLARPLDADARDIAAMIRNGADMLSTLLGDLRDFANLRSGLLGLRRERFDLGRVLEEAGRSLAAAAAENRLRLILQYRPAKAPRLFLGDAERLRQLLRHLAAHALSIPYGRHLVLRVEACAPEPDPSSDTFALRSRIRLTALDNGPGLDAETLRRFQEENPPPPATELPNIHPDAQQWRLGLGLPFAHSLARFLGGRLRAGNHPNGGACLQVDLTLPVDTDALHGEASPLPFAGRRILIADADREERLALRAIMERFGGSVEEAAGDAEALMRLRVCDTPPDAVIVDQELGRLDDLRLIHAIKNDPDLRQLPVIGLAPGLPVDDYRSLPEGWVSLLLSKPVFESGLLHGLRAVFRPRTIHWERLDFPVPAPAPDGTRPGSSTVLLLSITPEMESQSPPPAATRTILVLEGHPHTRRLLRRLLVGYGYQVHLAADAEQALKTLSTRSVDLVVADLQMPDMDAAYALLDRQAKVILPGHAVRVLGLAASGPWDAPRHPRPALLDTCLAKPVDPIALRNAIHRLLQ